MEADVGAGFPLAAQHHPGLAESGAGSQNQPARDVRSRFCSARGDPAPRVDSRGPKADSAENYRLRLAHFILREVGKAAREFDMLADHDRVAVAVSGGKDSLSLLSLLQRYRQTAGVRFELAAIHVRGDATGVTAAHPPLDEHLAGLGIPYRVVEPELSAEDAPPLECRRCTWLRRKALFLAADSLECNVVAFAHHADDAAQTTLLNLLYNGSTHTLAPNADYFDGHFRLIRPLIYTAESELARYARACGFPPPPPACPRAGDSRRKLVADMLKMLDRDYLTQARPNLVRVGIRSRTKE